MSTTKMPRFVEDAEKMANELWEKQYGKTVKPATEGNVEPLEDAIPSEAKLDDSPKLEGEPEATPEPEPTPEPTPTPEPEPTPTPAPTEDWEHKFNVLQGKYNAEVPSLAYELAQVKQENKELRKPKEEPEVKPKVDLESNEKIKAFRAEYPDVVDAVKIITNVMLDERLGRFDEKISKVEKTVGTVTETIGQNDRERFKTDLDIDTDVGKEWRAMNKDPEFIKSLQGQDIYTGQTKQELLQNAWNRMDKAATLQFFKDFKATKSSKPAPTVKAKDVDPMKIDPPKGASGGPNIDTDRAKVTTTLAEIDKFYKDSAAGLYRGKDAEFEKEERRLLKAIGVIKK